MVILHLHNAHSSDQLAIVLVCSYIYHTFPDKSNNFIAAPSIKSSKYGNLYRYITLRC